ncbi:hypothetical protein KC343_g2679 [Hortaea werneckii]|nr:hypothetical protein KC352_g9962 [Hortaea werneckii]KAI7568265.1 hypothetical protein KC317_g4352 [Hortaea werneckii]KAI7623481.1 hypothetical protein KC346_g2720 [Hortaea werneckii]KAI7633868.1 hypothetical protein KC343_g2679 [Hortaea werneckii]KAI7681862.1 hypothetical protein KC319_g1329 [Hortaea werneckii]
MTDVTIPQFLAWNPNFNSLCQNSLSFVGYKVCLSNPGGSSKDTTGTATGSIETATATEPAPSNALPESNKPCAEWYTVSAGDDCSIVSVAHSISLTDFLFLNPEINEKCTNLLLDIAYCVRPVGSIQAYEGYTKTTTARITVPPATFSSVNTAISTRTNNPGFIASSTSLPKAPGTDSGCKTYRNFDGQRGVNSCSDIASLFLISVDDLLEWNPSLDRDIASCALESGNSYCVSKSDGMPPPDGEHCLEVDSTVDGTVATCNCYTIVKGYEIDTYLCSDLQADYSVTREQLVTWNPWLDPECDTKLYAGLVGNEKRSVCIGVNATGPQDTTSKSPTSTAPQTGTVTTVAMGPTRTDIAAKCQAFYTVTSGDTCYDIETSYGITFEEFLDWNPSGPSESPTNKPTEATSAPVASSSCTVEVTFETTHSTEWGENIWVVGSLKELGEWTVKNAFMLTGRSQGSTTAWSGTIELPPNQGIGYKFVKLQVDGTAVWESDPNRGLDTPPCGEPGITAGGPWQVGDAEPSCEAVDVSFGVLATTEYGEGISVVGSTAQLGEWDTARAVALSPDEYPLWKKNISMPLGQEGQFKYVKQKLDGSFAWEADPNRMFVAPNSCQPVAATEDTWQE